MRASPVLAVLLALALLPACRRPAPPAPADASADSALAADAARAAAADTLAGAPAYLVRGFPPTHLAAAEAYVDSSGLQRAFEENLRASLTTRLPPAMLPIAFAWQARYLGREATRPAFARLLADRLAEPELRGLVATGLPPDTTGFDRRLVGIVEESRRLGAYLIEQQRPELEAMLRRGG